VPVERQNLLRAGNLAGDDRKRPVLADRVRAPLMSNVYQKPVIVAPRHLELFQPKEPRQEEASCAIDDNGRLDLNCYPLHGMT
jgi:hypothetical protein